MRALHVGTCAHRSGARGNRGSNRRHDGVKRAGQGDYNARTPPRTPNSNSTSAASLWPPPAFVQFWFARIASGFGFQMLSVAVGWQIYEITGRALDLGLIGLVQFIPSVLLALPAGHVAAQFERRRIVLLGQIVDLVAIAVLAALSLLHTAHEASILA